MNIKRVLVVARSPRRRWRASATSNADSGATAASWAPAGRPVPHQSLAGLDPQLSDLARSGLRSGSTAAVTTARAEGLEVSGGSVRVIVDPAGSVDSATAAIAAAGGTVEAKAGRSDPGSHPAGCSPVGRVELRDRRREPSGKTVRPGRRRRRRCHRRRRLADRGLQRRKREGRDHRPRVPGLPIPARDGSARFRLGYDRQPLRRRFDLVTGRRQHEPRHRRRRDRPPDGAGRAARPDVHRHRARSQARRAGRDRRRRQDHQPLGVVVQHQPGRRNRRRELARRDGRRRTRERNPLGERGGKLRDAALERQASCPMPGTPPRTTSRPGRP